MENDSELLRQTYQLAKENNRMLHAMRRSAFFGGIFKLIIYAALLFIPLWLYMQYLGPQINRMMTVVAQVQGTSQQAQVQISEWQKTWDDLKAKIPGMSSTTKK